MNHLGTEGLQKISAQAVWVNAPFLSGHPFLSGYFYRAMIIAMAAMRIMQMAADQIVSMISMRYGFMAASGSVHMFLLMHSAFVPRCAFFRICFCHGYDMLINMIAMGVVQMPVVQIVDVVVVNYTCMSAFRPVRMSMIFVLWQVTISHCRFLVKE